MNELNIQRTTISVSVSLYNLRTPCTRKHRVSITIEISNRKTAKTKQNKTTKKKKRMYARRIMYKIESNCLLY